MRADVHAGCGHQHGEHGGNRAEPAVGEEEPCGGSGHGGGVIAGQGEVGRAAYEDMNMVEGS